MQITTNIVPKMTIAAVSSTSIAATTLTFLLLTISPPPFGVANKPTVLQTKLLHMGKSGGGTVVDRTHKLGFVMMHGETQTPRSVEQMQKKKTLILTIRDPVDRFRSNFYWLSLVACRLDRGDKRGEHSRRCNAHRETEKCCKVYKKGDVIDMSKLNDDSVFWSKYNRNASKLAEAFCGYDYEGQQQEAIDDMQLFVHARKSIHDWLFGHSNSNTTEDNNNVKNGSNTTNDDIEWMDGKLIAVVQEPGYDFIEQIDGAIEWVLSKTTTTANITDSFRLQYTKNKKTEHSSQSPLTFPWVLPPEERSAITYKGACCLARYYYRQDYELLSNANFIDRVCKGPMEDACRQAMQSITNRRAVLFEGSDPCSGGDGNGNGTARNTNSSDNSRNSYRAKSAAKSATPVSLSLPFLAREYETYSLGLLIGGILPLLLLYFFRPCMRSMCDARRVEFLGRVRRDSKLS